MLGGYGGFGRRIVRRLALAGHDVVVAGRSLEKARGFCAGLPRLTPVALDRDHIAPGLADIRPVIVVDASGPFQAMDHAVPAACIAAGIHYVDIADGRAFVCSIGALDDAAKAAGVVVLSGASSVPALSGAAVRRLAEGMDRVSAVEMAISASNRATAGPAVAASILGQVGQPMRLWRGQRWVKAFGWQEMRRTRFALAGSPPLTGRSVALVEVPDLALLPARLAGRPSVSFRAGTELAFQNAALWIAGRFVRAGLVKTLAPLAHVLQPLQSLTGRLGSDRSAMLVRLFGTADGRRIERRWTLIAEQGDGPEIPTLSVEPLVSRILSGAEAPGARDAGQSLTLEDYDQAFDALAIRHAVEERVLPPALYERVMGMRFGALPPEVREMHNVVRDGGVWGEAEVTAASNPIAALIARIVGFPPAGRHRLHVHFAEADGIETWTRDFGGKRFRSRLSQRGNRLVERFGPLRFTFTLPSDEQGLAMDLQRWWVGPLRLPLAWAPRSPARE